MKPSLIPLVYMHLFLRVVGAVIMDQPLIGVSWGVGFPCNPAIDIDQLNSQWHINSVITENCFSVRGRPCICSLETWVRVCD